jgi:hypothetical protein
MKRWPVIRHIRYWILRYRLSRWIDFCQRHGLGLVPQESDVRYLLDVWDGKV